MMWLWSRISIADRERWCTKGGGSYPGKNAAMVPQSIRYAVHVLFKISLRVRAHRTRCQTPSLLRGLIFGSDGRAESLTRRGGAVASTIAIISEPDPKGAGDEPARGFSPLPGAGRRTPPMLDASASPTTPQGRKRTAGSRHNPLWVRLSASRAEEQRHRPAGHRTHLRDRDRVRDHCPGPRLAAPARGGAQGMARGKDLGPGPDGGYGPSSAGAAAFDVGEALPCGPGATIRLLVDRVDIGPGGAELRLKLEGLGRLMRHLVAPAETARLGLGLGLRWPRSSGRFLGMRATSP